MVSRFDWKSFWVLVGAVLTARTLIGAVLALSAIAQPETHMLALLDVPALLVAAALHAVTGWPTGIRDLYDPAFIVSAIVAWAALAAFVGFITVRLRLFRVGPGRLDGTPRSWFARNSRGSR